MVIIIRPALCNDVRAIAEVHIASWRSTYRGIVTDEFLDRASVEDQVRQWSQALCPPQAQRFLHVAEDNAEKVIGFVGGGSELTHDPDYKGEIYVLYLLEEHQRKGFGRALLKA